EWAVLEMGNPGVVAAVNKRVFCEIEESGQISVTVDDFDIKNVKGEFDGKALTWDTNSDEEKDRLKFMKAAIETTFQYLGEHKTFRIRSWGEMSQVEVDGEMKKIGFGSSAASVVATVASVLALHGQDVRKRETRDVIYKLSTIAHYFAQGKIGSAFDVAASTYGGVFVYKRFDPKWLEDKIESGKIVKEIVSLEWPGFYVEELQIPEDFRLEIGWTKSSASTSEMVKQMKGFKESNKQEYDRIYGDIGSLVKELISYWKEHDKKNIIKMLRKNEDYLRELGEKSGVGIETHDLRMLSEIANDHGAAGKLSGAGGGDCGIAVVFDKEAAENIKKDWKEKGLHIIDATVDRDGVIVNQ
ncbi:MAG: phosphomevalonate kinase, partial [Candidatus Aenigmatarchaeota archaeon]